MKKKKIVIIVGILLVLAAGIAVLLYLETPNREQGQKSQENAEITIVKGNDTVTFNLDYLESLEAKIFTTIENTSSTDDENVTFTGVPLITVLKSKGITLDGASTVTFTAADSYASVINASDAVDAGKIYLVYKKGGDYLGTKAEGGDGPIEMIVCGDQFSTRWCKYLMKIEIS